MKTQQVRKTLQLISLLLFPAIFFYFSPAIIIFGAIEGIAVGSFLIFVTLFVLSLYFGRAFCGWVCATGGMQELCGNVQDKPVKRGKWLKYAIWLPWLAAITLLFLKVGGIKRFDPLFNTNHGLSLGEPASYIVYFIVLALIVVLALTVGKRSFCHHVCWIAPFMVVGGKLRDWLHLPALHLEAASENCTKCLLCNKKCPMSLDVVAMVQRGKVRHVDCILCGECVAACPKGVIRYKFR